MESGRQSARPARRPVVVRFRPLMPIYEYRCASCGKHAELFQRRRRAPGVAAPPCPACASTDMRALFSAFAVSVDQNWAGFDGTNDLDSDDPEAVKAWADGLAETTGQPYPPGFTDAMTGDFDDDDDDF